MFKYLVALSVLVVACSDHSSDDSLTTNVNVAGSSGSSSMSGGSAGDAGQGGSAGNAIAGATLTTGGASGSGTSLCAPGAVMACSCQDGASGVQQCVTSGDGWSQCACLPSAGGSGGSTSGGASGSAGAAGSSNVAGGPGNADVSAYNAKQESNCEANKVNYPDKLWALCPLDDEGRITCEATSSDSNNCGGCGIQCDADSTCSNGTCVSNCQYSGGDKCSDPNPNACYYLASDTQNCGTCGTDCTKKYVMLNGNKMACNYCETGVCKNSFDSLATCQ